MNKRYSIAEARDNFTAIVHELEVTPSIEITRRGESVAVLLAKQEYDRLQSDKTGFWSAYKAYRKKVKLVELQIDPAKVFGDLRDRGSGRRVDF